MKKFFNGLCSAVLLTALFASCKKDIASDTPDTKSMETVATVAGGNGSLSPAPMYSLVRMGGDSLVYDASGRLAKVVHSAGRISQYSYGLNTITSETVENGKTVEKRFYQLDANKNRVVESEEHKYSYPSPNVTWHEQKWFKFEYNADGQLSKKYNKNHPNERSQFGWGANGNLASLYFYDETNDLLYRVHFSQNAVADKLKLNSVRSKLEPYLRIFGKVSNNMTSYEQVYLPGSNTPDVMEHFTYQFNKDGYPTSCVVANALTNKRINQFGYAYRVMQ